MTDTSLLEALTEQLDREVTNKLQTEKLARFDANPEEVEQGLAKLVLTLIELIRQLLERQAVRRVESGNLTEAQIERMGETFIRLEARMKELKVAFGLENEELNINLGPLGNLL
ncbi:MAG: gas vesicle protein K [Chloroflexota bacterium]|nr:gas vesicle protein K [Chloroflexota bacterium]